MSWAISKKVGAPEKLLPVMITEFDRAAAHYKGSQEFEDVMGAKEAVTSWLSAASAQGVNCAEVEASGSRGAGWLSIKVECKSVALVQ